jgi:hypothetical protein
MFCTQIYSKLRLKHIWTMCSKNDLIMLHNCKTACLFLKRAWNVIQTCLKCDPNMLQKCFKCDRHMYFETWWHSMFFVKTCLKCDSNMLQSCFLFDRFVLPYIVIGTRMLKHSNTACSSLKRDPNVLETCLKCDPNHGLATEEGRRTSFQPLRYGCQLQPENQNKHG